MSGITSEELAACASIPIRFTVASRLRSEAVNRGLCGIALVEEPVASPYDKDYDALPGAGPLNWPRWFDVSGWKMILLRDDTGEAAAAATVAARTPGMLMLENDPTRAVLWDLRVRPEVRGRGWGRKAVERATDWARSEGLASLHIETQNNNVAACRFYAACGAELVQIRQHAYHEFPDESMMIWRLPLVSGTLVADASRESGEPAGSPVAWRVRRAVAGDWPAVLACDPLASRVERREKLERHGAAGEIWVATGRDDGVAPVGYMVATPTFFDRWFVELLCVSSAGRRQGVGAALLDHAVDLAGDADVFTSTNASNQPMRRLLRRQGWLETGWIDGLDPGDPEVFYQTYRGSR